jgi:hypothetical protein
LTLSSAR